jgi:hypothetical protein
MPYKKGSIAEQMGKLRRTANRRIDRLNKEIAMAGSDRERTFYKQQINTLREQISKTYQRDPKTNRATGFTKDELRIAAQNLKRTNASSLIGTSQQARKNYLTAQELNRAEYHDMIGPTQSQFTREEVSIFYRATQRAWEGLSSKEDRNKAILKYYNETDLESFVKKVLRMNKKAVDIANKEPSSLYRSPQDISDVEARDNRQPSPTFLSYVVSPEQYDVMREYIEEPEAE